jgi:hypothetical protein
MLFIMITIFCDFRQKTLRFSSKPMFWSKLGEKNWQHFVQKNTNLLAKFFGGNILKIGPTNRRRSCSAKSQSYNFLIYSYIQRCSWLERFYIGAK